MRPVPDRRWVLRVVLGLEVYVGVPLAVACVVIAAPARDDARPSGRGSATAAHDAAEVDGADADIYLARR